MNRQILKRLPRSLCAAFLTLVVLAGCGGGGSSGASGGATGAATAADKDHRSFGSAQEAVDALVAALKAGDSAQETLLFGPGSERIVSSGDTVADANARQKFLEAYQTKHSLVAGSGGSMVLQIGADDWPMPVPLVQRDGRWYLDGAAGADEIAIRRVGRNELGAIAVARGFVDAENLYASEGRDGNEAGLYAGRLISDEGRHNGLYWPTKEGESPSPVGDFVASAAGEGYRRGANGEPTPYHGYFYRMLYAQGANAPGGAKDYYESGALVDGFALIAWPADYGASGVKTFMVSQDGVVYEKDLGPDTATAAGAIELFDPDSTWSKVESQPKGAS